MKNPKGYEITALNPGWIHKEIRDKDKDIDFFRIILFYVINTPCIELSTSSLPMSHYGWKSKVWKDSKLKDELFSIAKLKRGTTYIAVKKTDEMKKACDKASLKRKFHDDRDVERIVVYKSKYNEFLSICYHLRNALAHGRFQIYENTNKEPVFAIEDGVKINGDFYVRSRMVLKKATLISWINIIEHKCIK